MKRITAALKNWWAEFNMSAEELYLSQASNHADLDRRMRDIMDPNFNATHIYSGFRR